MNAALVAAVVAPGLALGSFLNVVASRLPAGRSVLHPRSACVSCDAPVAWRDNIPLLSWALLRGRCRHCRAQISLLYPAVELATALLVVACVLAFGFTLRAAAACVFSAALVVVTATDLTHRIVPNKVVLPGAAVVLALMTLAEPSPEWLIAALVPAIVLFARHGSKARKMAIPFAPFLALGSLVALFAGEALLEAYLAAF